MPPPVPDVEASPEPGAVPVPALVPLSRAEEKRVGININWNVNELITYQNYAECPRACPPDYLQRQQQRPSHLQQCPAKYEYARLARPPAPMQGCWICLWCPVRFQGDSVTAFHRGGLTALAPGLGHSTLIFVYGVASKHVFDGRSKSHCYSLNEEMSEGRR